MLRPTGICTSTWMVVKTGMETSGGRRALVGRDAEIDALDRLLLGIRRGGAAVLVRGEDGIGKSALLEHVVGVAAERGVRALRTTGAESEATLPFAGLHQLLRPLLGRLPALPAPQRRALEAAFGMTDDASPELFLIGLAALTLISDAAADQPTLLVVDDAHWLDRPSAEVLGFVGRRLESEAVVLVAAQRNGFPAVLDGPGLVECRLERLDLDAAEQVLAVRSRHLHPVDRQRLLVEAAGNPLALAELPLVAGRDRCAPLSLTARLEQAFAARTSGLPRRTQTLLLLASLNDDGALRETLAAASALTGEPVSAEGLTPAVEAQLVSSDGVDVTFRHPLVRHAIRQRATLVDRQRAHSALARVVGDADRRLWHRAAACQGPDDEVAAELEAAAARDRHRGGVAAAEAALERAAGLTADPVRRAERYLRAAELAFEWGRQDVVDRLLREIAVLDLPAQERTRMTWIRESFDEGIHDVCAGARKLADVAAAAAAEGQTDLALKFLYGAALRCWWADPGAAVRARVVEVAEQTLVDPDDPRLLAVLAFAAPLQRGAVVHERLRGRLQGPAEPGGTRLAGNTATVVGAFDMAVELLTSAVADLRADGQLGLLARSLVLQGWSALHLGRLDLAASAADEAARLATDSSQPLIRAVALVVQSAVSALRGGEDAAELVAEADQVGLQVNSSAVLAAVQLARGVAALSSRQHQAAWDHLIRIHEPADPAHHEVIATFTVADLVEAAVNSGHRREVQPVLDRLEAIAARTPSPMLHIGLRYSRALLASDDDAERLFSVALSAELGPWPFARARAQLAQGAWLRRRRRAAESRAPLRAARDTFDALGAGAWGDRARSELRAAGEKSRPRTPEARQQLSPQELVIAQMAAEGLTNREIGDRLYLSHRTIGTHLHRIFPKLGVTSRVALGAAIGS